MDFSRKEYWSGLPLPPPGDLPDPGTDSESPVLQMDPLPLSHQGDPQGDSLSQIREIDRTGTSEDKNPKSQHH